MGNDVMALEGFHICRHRSASFLLCVCYGHLLGRVLVPCCDQDLCEDGFWLEGSSLGLACSSDFSSGFLDSPRLCFLGVLSLDGFYLYSFDDWSHVVWLKQHFLSPFDVYCDGYEDQGDQGDGIR